MPDQPQLPNPAGLAAASAAASGLSGLAKAIGLTEIVYLSPLLIGATMVHWMLSRTTAYDYDNEHARATAAAWAAHPEWSDPLNPSRHRRPGQNVQEHHPTENPVTWLFNDHPAPGQSQRRFRRLARLRKPLAGSNYRYLVR